MVRGSRYVFALFAWVFVAAILAQVFLAGLGIFGDDEMLGTHAEVGWIIHLSPILILIAAALGRVGLNALLWTVALFVVMFVQPIAATLRQDSPALAALHPVLALVVFWLGLTVAIKATRLARAGADRPGTGEATTGSPA